MMGSDLIDTDIGPDTVTLVFRDPATGFDDHGRPNVTERLVDKSGCALSYYLTKPSLERDEYGSIADIQMTTCRLPIDDDTTALRPTDAIRFGGFTFEMQGPPLVQHALDTGLPADHVYTNLQWAGDTGRGEVVTVTPNGGRDDDGNAVQAGDPFDVIAFDVEPGDTTAKFGRSGEMSEAAFTIVLPVDTPIEDDDWITVRGKVGRARIQLNLPQFAGRERLVVLVDTKSGGAV